MKLSIISKNDLIIFTACMIAQGSASIQCASDSCYVNYLRQQFGKPLKTYDCCTDGVSCENGKVTKM